MTYYLHKVSFSSKNFNLVTAKSDQDPDPHWFGSLNPDPHCGKQLDPDSHEK
jgi:hypothetical protein